MSAAKPKSKNFAGRELTEDEVDRILTNDRLRYTGTVILMSLIGLGLFSLMLTPLAKSIAGTDTNFNLQISFAFNFALGLTALSGGAGCYGLNKARRHHKRRARALEVKLAAATGLS